MAEDTEDEKTKAGKATTDKEILKLALKRFKLAEEAETDIRKSMLQALEFRAGDQWPDELKRERELDQRPCLTIDQIGKQVRQVTNENRQNRPGIKFLPTSDATEEKAEIKTGMVRQIMSASPSDVAIDAASDMQVSIGLGYLRVITEYINEMSFDQDIKIKRVKNPFTVYFDPSAQEYDYSDAKWCFIVSDMARPDFINTYDGDAEDISNYALSSVGDEEPSWSTQDTIRVAEYFYVDDEKIKIYKIEDEDGLKSVTEAQKKQIEDAGIEFKEIDSRETFVRSVKWCKITSIEILEKEDWAGKYIPVIPVIGEDYDINGKRVIRGMVQPAIDAQRMYNYHSSAFTEAISLAPKAPFVMAEGQNEGYERYWENANKANYSCLIYKPTTLGDQLAPPPQRQTAEPPVQALALAIRQASQDVKDTTGIYGANLGEASGEKSGKAILARQQEGDTSNYHYSSNMAHSVRFLGIVLDDLIPHIYDTERAVRILKEDDKSELIIINQWVDGEDGEDGSMPLDMTTGDYDLQVTTGPSFTTKRQESATAMINMANAYPMMTEVGGDIMVRNQDWPGADELSDRLKRTIPPEILGKDDDDDSGEQQVPPEAQQMLEEQGKMIEQLTGALDEANTKLETKEPELQSKERISAADNENKILIQEMKQRGDAQMAAMEQRFEEINTRMEASLQNASTQANEWQGEQGNKKGGLFSKFR